LVILPVTAALAIAVFAAGVFAAASTWRASTAATEVGADLSMPSPSTLSQTVAVTHRIDPEGRWLMAAGVVIEGDYGEKLVLDTPRLARVGVWPGTWTPGLDAAAIADLLGPRGSGVTLRGRSFAMTLDNEVDAKSSGLGVSVKVETADGASQTLFFGPFEPGRSTRTVTAGFCADGCLVRAVLVGGPATTSTTMKGTASVTGFTQDGRSVAAMTTPDAWRLFISPLGLTPETTQIDTAGTGLRLTLDTKGKAEIGGVTPADVPGYRPVLMGRTQEAKVEGGSGDRLVVKTDALEGLPVHVEGQTESMPFLGPHGLVIDYTMMTRDQAIPDDQTDVYVLARGDTPADVLAALSDHGVNGGTELDATKDVLDQDAYALSLNLYLVVAMAAVTLALAGLAVNMAVQLPDRRRDAASLRVVGVPRRQILRAVFVEIGAVLGAAGLAGIVAGAVAQYLVVRTVRLGLSDQLRTPRVVPTLDADRLALLTLAVVAVLVVIAGSVAALAVQRARASTLRESTR
jgi:putative ABC transport system permease protein